MTFWIWTFFKINKCPKSISSKKCFLGALKNQKENAHFISALKMQRNTKFLKWIKKYFWGFLEIFLDIFHFWTFLAQLAQIT